MNIFEQFFNKTDKGKAAKQPRPPHKAPPFTPEMMEEGKFWQLIDRSYRKANGNYHLQQAELTALLLKEFPVESLLFQNRFYDYLNQAYHWDLWGLAYLMQGGCSDDSFFDFRGWLISLGKDRYAAVLQNPDTIADVAYATGEIDWEGISWSAHSAYSQLTGKIMPAAPGGSNQPEGSPWEEEDLPQRFPATWARWGG